MIKPKDPDLLEPIDTELGAKAAQEATAGPDARPGDRLAQGAGTGDGGGRGPAGEFPDEGLQDPADDSAEHVAAEDAHAEHGGRSLAATALMALVGVLVISGLALWAAPKLAPHVPAAVGKYLMPGQADLESRLAAMDQALAEAGSRAAADAGALSGQIAELAQRVAAAETAGAEALTVAEAASGAASALAERLTAVESENAALRAEQAAVSTALSEAASGAGAGSPELAAAMAALSERIEKLSARVEQRQGSADFDARIDGLLKRIEAAEATAAAARSAQDETLGEVSSAIREASLRAALAALSGRVAGGGPYAAQLGDVAALAGTPAPEALVLGAESGLATAATLAAAFPPAAQAAVRADVQAQSGGGISAQVFGWLRAQVTGRPTSEQAGDSVGAIVSRVGARIEDGDLDMALAEAETLPDHSQAAMGDWLVRLRGTVAAQAALESWLAEIGAGG